MLKHKSCGEKTHTASWSCTLFNYKYMSMLIIHWNQQYMCSVSSVNAQYLLRVRIRMLLLLYRRRVSTHVWAKIISIWYSWGEKRRVNTLIWQRFQSSIEKGRRRAGWCLCAKLSQWSVSGEADHCVCLNAVRMFTKVRVCAFDMEI